MVEKSYISSVTNSGYIKHFDEGVEMKKVYTSLIRVGATLLVSTLALSLMPLTAYASTGIPDEYSSVVSDLRKAYGYRYFCK